MTLGIADSLFHWVKEHGSVAPTVGGRPAFVRAGNAFTEQTEALSLVLPIDTPRFEPDGLRLELVQDNELSDPFSVDDTTSPWDKTASMTVTAATSFYDGRIAYQHDSSASQIIRSQTIGVFTANPETCYVDIEPDDATVVTLGVYDSTAGDWVLIMKGTYSTGVTTEILSGLGSAEDHGMYKLKKIGPNGGPMWRVWFTVTPANPGNTRYVRLYPLGNFNSTTTAYIHYVDYVEASFFTSPKEGIRVIENFYWANGPKPQAMVRYLRFVELMDNGGVPAARIWTTEDTGSDTTEWKMFRNSDTAYRLYIQNAGNVASSNLTMSPDVGDLMESVSILNADGSGRLVMRKNSGAVSAVAVVAPTGGLPIAWDGGSLVLNGAKNGSSIAACQYQALKDVTQTNIVSALDGSGTGDEDIMTEMAAFWISEDGLSVSNTNEVV